MPDKIKPQTTAERLFGDFATRVEEVLKKRPDAVTVLYAEQMEWARHFNELIWTIGTILVPASLAGFAIELQASTASWTGIASCGLLLFWGLLGSWHRTLWGRAFEVTGLIEEKWGLRPADAARRRWHMLYYRSPIDYGYILRWGLVIVGIFAWWLKLGGGVGFPAVVPLALLLVGLVVTFLGRSSAQQPPSS